MKWLCIQVCEKALLTRQLGKTQQQDSVLRAGI